MSAAIRVNTTNNVDVPAGFVMVSSNLRDTDKVKVPEDQRYRNAVIPELSIPSVEDKFRIVLLSALYDVAKRRFEAEMEDSKRMATEINPEHYTVSALLAYFETEATSGRLTSKQVEEWFAAGDTFALVKARKGEKEAKQWLGLFSKFASPNHGVNPNTCRVLLASMQPKDVASDIGKAIAAKMQKTIEKSEVSVVSGL